MNKRDETQALFKRTANILAYGKHDIERWKESVLDINWVVESICAYPRNATFQLLSFCHFLHPGKNLRLKHSSHSSDLRLGKVASSKMKGAAAKLKISIQLCLGASHKSSWLGIDSRLGTSYLGTIRRQLRCLSELSSLPDRSERPIGFLQGFKDGSDTISWSRWERYEIIMREPRSSSLRMSAMSSTGRVKKVAMMVTGVTGSIMYRRLSILFLQSCLIILILIVCLIFIVGSSLYSNLPSIRC